MWPSSRASWKKDSRDGRSWSARAKASTSAPSSRRCGRTGSRGRGTHDQCSTPSRPDRVSAACGGARVRHDGPVPAPLPGWEAFAGRGPELMLPPGYEGGDPVALAEELAALLADVPQYAAIAEAIRNDHGGGRLLAIDRETGSIVAGTANSGPEGGPMGRERRPFHR